MSISTERPAIANEPLSIALLALREDGSQEAILRQWVEFLEPLARPFEILLLGDGRTESPRRQLESLAATFPWVKVLRTDKEHGPGAALRLAIAEARYPLFFYSELSGCYSPSDLKTHLDSIDQADMSCGFRSWPSGHLGVRVRESLYGWLMRLFFGVRLKDANCLSKLMRKSILKRIPIQADGHFVHVELVAKANFLGCLMGEVPVTFRPENAVPPQTAQPETRSVYAEAKQVFRDPDFGPVQVSEPRALATGVSSPGADASGSPRI